MLKNFVVRLMLLPYLLDEAGDTGGAGGAGGDGDGNSAADNGGKPQGGDGADGKAGSGKGTPQGGGKPEDDPRYKGMLADLKKERTARQQAERDRDARIAEVEQERRRVQALAGVNTPSKEEADAEAIRQRMKQYLPELGEMTKEDIEAIREMKTLREEMRAATNHTWTTHATKMLSSLRSGMESALGGKLSERQAQRIEIAYVETAKSNPEFLARHEAGDPKLIDEFVKEWLDDFVEPGKRAALAAEAAKQRRVPDGKGRTINSIGDKKIDVNDPKAVEDALVAGFRGRGGQFGRRS